MENCRHTLKHSRFKLFAQKNSNITLFCERNLTTFIASIYMENGKVLKKECQWSAVYAMAKVNIRGGKSCR